MSCSRSTEITLRIDPAKEASRISDTSSSRVSTPKHVDIKKIISLLPRF
jgi:hypothetical protein